MAPLITLDAEDDEGLGILTSPFAHGAHDADLRLLFHARFLKLSDPKGRRQAWILEAQPIHVIAHSLPENSDSRVKRVCASILSITIFHRDPQKV